MTRVGDRGAVAWPLPFAKKGDPPKQPLRLQRPDSKRGMEGAAHLSVPLTVDTGQGRNLEEAH